MSNENQQVTATFTDAVGVLNRSATGVAEKALAIGIDAVHKAYSGDNLAFAQYALDNVPKYVARALYAWFKRAGLNVISPAVGSSKYIVSSVVDKTRQAKVFLAIKTRPVIETVVSEKAKPKDKVLKGTPQERAQTAIDKTIERLKTGEDSMAAGIVSARVAESFEVMTLITKDGAEMRLTSAQYDAVMGLLDDMREFAKPELLAA